MTAHFFHLLDDLKRQSLRMASLVEDMFAEACEAAFDNDDALARRVVIRDGEVDTDEVAVEAEVIRLMALYQPVGSDLRLLCTVLKANNDLERVADCAVNIAERARHLDPRAAVEVGEGIKRLIPIVRGILRDAIRAYGNGDVKAAEAVLARDDAIDAAYGQIVRTIIDTASRSPASMPTQLDWLSIAKNLERIADHATNIAEDVIFLSTGKIVRHQRTAAEVHASVTKAEY